MSNQEMRTRRRKTHVEPTEAGPETGGPSPLLEQALAWTNVARDANDDCVKGDEAEKELRARRNESGQ
jgi:hypothetical protein